MRILFMGTPDIAAECLKALYAAGHDICAVYTRRDKPVGRKQVLTAPPVKEVALAHGTPVFQPRTLRDGSEDENIRADVMPGGIQGFEALCGNIRRAHEQNAHYLFPFASRAAFLPSSVSS